MTSPIILASGSEIRKTMLQNAGIEFTTELAKIDEETVKLSMLAENAHARDIADRLAEMKAVRISAKRPDSIVIGSDQVLEFEGRLQSKPNNTEEARDQLRALRGRKHLLHAAVVIARNAQPVWRFVGKAQLTMQPLSDGFIDAYLLRMGQEALQTVGSYKLENEGVRLFSKIEGDYFSVLGMPLVETLGQLVRLGSIEK